MTEGIVIAARVSRTLARPGPPLARMLGNEVAKGLPSLGASPPTLSPTS